MLFVDLVAWLEWAQWCALGGVAAWMGRAVATLLRQFTAHQTNTFKWIDQTPAKRVRTAAQPHLCCQWSSHTCKMLCVDECYLTNCGECGANQIAWSMHDVRGIQRTHMLPRSRQPPFAYLQNFHHSWTCKCQCLGATMLGHVNRPCNQCLR